MAAAAYKVNMVAALGSPNGAKKPIPLTASDVNGEFWLFPSGASEIVLNGSQDVYITDILLSAAGTDTSQVEIFISGTSTGIKLLNATNLYTTVMRPVQQAPIRIPKGEQVKFKQLT